MQEQSAIYWLKRDFRLVDNPALTAALKDHESVMMLFIMEPTFLNAPETSAFHVNAIITALTDLQDQLSKVGG